MAATFVISFDCEGKWGVADHLDNFYREMLTNKRLNFAYQKIIDILNNRCIKGTFAFVGAFTMSIDEYLSNRDNFHEIYVGGKPYLSAFRQDADKNIFDGWFNPIPIQIVTKDIHHEIAAHGFCHIPLSELFIDRYVFLREMNLLKKVSCFRERKNMTFIYPRNLLGYTEELANFSFIGFRDGLSYQDISNNTMLQQYGRKLTNIVNEFNIFEKAQPHSQPDQTVKIPSGYFLNWRYSLRKKIPLSVTLKRWKNIFNDAVSNNKVVHLYTHPHNFITGDYMYEMLDEILKIVSQLVNKNDCVNLTQKEYVETINNGLSKAL